MMSATYLSYGGCNLLEEIKPKLLRCRYNHKLLLALLYVNYRLYLYYMLYYARMIKPYVL